MRKFQAKYRVTVYSKFQTITVNYPITCKFNVSRGLFAQSNKANIQLYNLSLSTRNMIFQDCLVINPDLFKYVRLEAGYNDSMSIVFEGRILQAYSYKSGGQTDVITEIQAQALDIFDCQTSVTFEAGTSFRDAYKKMASDMPNVKFNNLGALQGTFKTNTTFDGNTFEQLNKLTGGHTYVDNNQLNCIMNNEAIKVPVPVIDDSRVLLETPRRRDANLQIKMLFEPSLLVGQLLEIGSTVSPTFNGQFKVIGFTHDCLISGTQAGSRTTSVDLFIGPLLPGADINLTGEKIESPTGAAASFNLVEGENIEPAVPTSPSNKWIMPAHGRISSPYGWRTDPFNGTRTFHKGLDIANNLGTQIKAPASGTAYYVGYENNLNGNTIRINHGNINGIHVESVYIHLQGFNIKSGQNVTQGQVIGFMGSTGHSTGSHLHMSVYEGKRGNHVNPFKYIDKTKY